MHWISIRVQTTFLRFAKLNGDGVGTWEKRTPNLPLIMDVVCVVWE